MSGLRTIAFITLITFSMLLLGCATGVSNLRKSDEETIARGEKSIVLPQSITELAPIGLMTTSTKILLSPHWKKRAMSRITRVEDENDVRKLISGLLSSPGRTPYTYGLILSYLLVGSAGGAIAGEISEHKWQPTIHGLQQELQGTDPAFLLNSARETMRFPDGLFPAINLNHAEDPFAQAKQQGLKSIIQTEILYIELRECEERGSFCVAVTLRIRLWETFSQVPLKLNCLFRFPNGWIWETSSKTLLYDKENEECSECRKMEEYGGVAGRKFLKDELSTAIQLSIQKLFNDVVSRKIYYYFPSNNSHSASNKKSL
jgi:hypothetical protein